MEELIKLLTYDKVANITLGVIIDVYESNGLWCVELYDDYGNDTTFDHIIIQSDHLYKSRSIALKTANEFIKYVIDNQSELETKLYKPKPNTYGIGEFGRIRNINGSKRCDP